MSETNEAGGARLPKVDPEKAYGSNAIRLTVWQWAAALVLFLAFYLAIPQVWQLLEPLKTTPDYRIPYALSEDYWLYSRYARQVAGKDQQIAVVGDSVVWGQYAAPGDTLTAHLNRLEGGDRFANLGVNGSHPAALCGLIRYYGGALSGGRVVLQFNPLWMTSTRRDLQIDRPTRFNHPALVPQFFPRIPCYDASFASRLSIAMGRELPFLQWTAHLRKTYFGNESLPDWSLKHPWENPLSVITLRLPDPDPAPPSAPVPWMDKESRLQSFDWVPVEESLQWRFFQESLALLQSRGNEVFVLLGPFNEHLMTETSRGAYAPMKAEMTAWLLERKVPHLAPEPLPSEWYADASHPIAAGYDLLAGRLMEAEAFRTFLAR